MIVFQKLIIENFKPFVGAYVIPLQDLGLVFIVGDNQVSQMADSNGAGKSAAIRDALTWSLYDRLVKPTTSERCINSTCEFACVQTYFRIGEKEYAAIREQRGRKREWMLCEVIDGITEPIGSGEEIESLLGLSFKAFVSILMFGTDTERFAEQSDAPRKQMFDELLDMAFFGEKRKLVDADLSTITEQASDLQQRVAQLTERVATLKQERQTLGDSTEAIELTAWRQWYDDHEWKMALFETLNRLFVRLQQARRAQVSEQALVDESTQLVAMRTRLEHRIGDVDQRIRKLLAEFGSVDRLGICTMCRRPITDKAEVARYFQDEMDTLAQQHRRCRLYQLDIQKLLDEWPALDPGQHHEAIKRELDRTLSDLRVVDGKLSQVQEARFLRQAVDELTERIDAAERELGVVSAEWEQVNAAIVLREFWLEGFGHRGLKAMLIRDYEAFLNGKLAQYSESLTAGELALTFSAQRHLKSGDVREEISFEAVNKFGAACYDDLSEGERQRVDLCVVLALQDLVRELHRGRFSLALYDEVFDHLDDTGCEQVMEYLTTQRRSYGSVFVISHSPRLLSYPSDHVIRVIKDEKGARIVFEN